MANAYECDLCGDLFRYYSGISVDSEILVYENKHKLDICPNCYRGIKNLIRTKRNLAKVGMQKQEEEKEEEK